jgi:hypothetical protein
MARAFAVLASLLLFTAAQAWAAKPTAKPHTVTADVVSVRTMDSSLTFKTPEGREITATVQGQKPMATLASLKTGEKVTVTYREDGTGTPAVVTSIRPGGHTASAKPASHSKP